MALPFVSIVSHSTARLTRSVSSRPSTTINSLIFIECDTIETNGSAINEQTLEVIRNAQQSRGVIVLTSNFISWEIWIC
jgi:5S rRNA maturation endonuclease (ribonuclease M5)